MKISVWGFVLSVLFCLGLMLNTGCSQGAGKRIARGAVRGASHGAIEQSIDSEIGRGAAHGALGAAHQVRDENRVRREMAGE
jgi:hypothetical protein